VGNAGNAADPSTGYGAVAYKYQIGKYEVTNAQYAEFLNAKAATDSYSLYNPSMASYGITRSGSSGSYSYSVTGGLENRPVVYVSWFDAARMANWMMNGQGSGDTETGAYTLNGATSGVVLANAGAQVYIPTENEWYKAAYYNGATSTYSLYPNGQNTITTADANYENSVGSSTNVGTYSSDPSFYGTFDQGGNVWERNDTVNYGSNYVLRGGCWLASTGSGVFQLASSFRFNYGPTVEAFIFGFRLASKQVNIAPMADAQTVSVNEDSTLAITLTGSDVDGSSLTYAVGTPSHGTLTGTAPNLTYTPDLDYNGLDSFTFTVNDGAADSAAATVSITVTPVTDLEYVTIGNAGNPADPTSGHGAVSRAYKIGKYEVTHAQYAEFLNRKASDTDVHELYSPSASDYGITVYGITRSGIPGNYTYSVESGMENRPIVLVTWFNAARFCNWLANGKGDGDTETGSYTLNGAMEGIINANPEAEVWIPTEDQWYKAAYYQGNGSYSIYPNGQNTMTAAEANCIDETGTYLEETTEVGAYAASPSHYGAFDLGGNVAEWTDGFEFMYTSEETGVSVDIFGRVYRGGSLGYEYYYMESRIRELIPPIYPDNERGFRVASMADDGGDVITERGVVYALTAINANPEIGGSGVIKVATTGTTGAFTVEITGLLGITNYSFKAYAINAHGTSYTPVGTFDTLVSTPIETWRNQYFGSMANAGAGADSASAGDGIVNLLKYALGIVPAENAASGLPKAKLVNNGSNRYLALTFKRDPARNDVTIVVQAGSDLSGWTEIARCASGGSFTGLATVTETQNLDGTCNVEVSDVQAVAGAPRRFMRVLVERPE
jgi:formylglycine-generating enzyme required for sulfatase activity